MVRPPGSKKLRNFARSNLNNFRSLDLNRVFLPLLKLIYRKTKILFLCLSCIFTLLISKKISLSSKCFQRETFLNKKIYFRNNCFHVQEKRVDNGNKFLWFDYVLPQGGDRAWGMFCSSSMNGSKASMCFDRVRPNCGMFWPRLRYVLIMVDFLTKFGLNRSMFPLCST